MVNLWHNLDLPFIPILSESFRFFPENGLIRIFRFFFADSNFLMALIPIFENLPSVVIHHEEKDGEARRNLHIPRKKEKENPES